MLQLKLPDAGCADRLGTNRAGGARFYPYGDEITSTAGDRTKFGTYNRDSFTGLDYADQRMYASGYGRFATADPYLGRLVFTFTGLLPSTISGYRLIQMSLMYPEVFRRQRQQIARADRCDATRSGWIG